MRTRWPRRCRPAPAVEAPSGGGSRRARPRSRRTRDRRPIGPINAGRKTELIDPGTAVPCLGGRALRWDNGAAPGSPPPVQAPRHEHASHAQSPNTFGTWHLRTGPSRTAPATHPTAQPGRQPRATSNPTSRRQSPSSGSSAPSREPGPHCHPDRCGPGQPGLADRKPAVTASRRNGQSSLLQPASCVLMQNRPAHHPDGSGQRLISSGRSHQWRCTLVRPGGRLAARTQCLTLS